MAYREITEGKGQFAYGLLANLACRSTSRVATDNFCVREAICGENRLRIWLKIDSVKETLSTQRFGRLTTAGTTRRGRKKNSRRIADPDLGGYRNRGREPELVTDLLILSDGTVLAHNLTPVMAWILATVNQLDEANQRRAARIPPYQQNHEFSD